MHAFIRFQCLLGALVLINGCGTKKVRPIKQVTDQSVKNTALVSFFEAQHADLFFPFSYQAVSVQSQELKDGDMYTIVLKVKASLPQMHAAYKEHMQMGGWRTIVETDTQLLFEKPYARCIITFLLKKEMIEIMMIYARLVADEQYQIN